MAWKKGESGNSKGRPRSGTSLAEAIRGKVDTEEFVSILLDVMRNSPNDLTKLRAMEMLAERGFKKPASVVEVGPADPYEDLSDEELAQLRADLTARLAAPVLEAELVEHTGDEVSRSFEGSEAASRTSAGRPQSDTCSTRTHKGVHVRKRVTESIPEQDEDTDT